MPSLLSAVSIVVPTFREAANIRQLVERTFAAVSPSGRTAELILVDDNSQDGTETIVDELSALHPIRLIVRRQERGLSSAVLAGFQAAEYDLFLVMDADLQHPPEMIPALIERLEKENCDFVIGTRYAQLGQVAQDWPMLRRLASRLATAAARPLAPLSDPMSGFFCIRRETWRRAERLNPIGYKIGLELYVKARCRHPSEIPIRFDARAAGQSKLSAGVLTGYLRQLVGLYWFRYPVLSGMLVLIGLVGATSALLLGTDALSVK